MCVRVREPFGVDEISVLISHSPCVDLLGFDKQQASHHSGPIDCLLPACTYFTGPLSSTPAAPVGLLCARGCPHNCLSHYLLLYKEMAHRRGWMLIGLTLGCFKVNIDCLIPSFYLLIPSLFLCVTSQIHVSKQNTFDFIWNFFFWFDTFEIICLNHILIIVIFLAHWIYFLFINLFINYL